MQETTYVIFTLDAEHYAISVHCVETIIRAVQLTDVPEATELLCGMLNMGGRFIPMVDIRKQFGLAQKPLAVSDRIMVCRVSDYTVAFGVDAIRDVTALAAGPLSSSAVIYPGMEQFLSGIAEYEGDSILIYDIDTLFPEKTIHRIESELKGMEAPV
jgi:purine-binding chemotaxis protein CheW